MTLSQGIALFVIGYLALLARSAWKQNELPQFLLSLAVVAFLFLVVGTVVVLYVRWTGP